METPTKINPKIILKSLLTVIVLTIITNACSPSVPLNSPQLKDGELYGKYPDEGPIMLGNGKLNPATTCDFWDDDTLPKHNDEGDPLYHDNEDDPVGEAASVGKFDTADTGGVGEAILDSMLLDPVGRAFFIETSRGVENIADLKLGEDLTKADLNLDSIDRVELLSMIEDEFNVFIDDFSISAQTTVAEIRKIIDSSTTTTTDASYFDLNNFLSPRTYIRYIFLKFIIMPYYSRYIKTRIKGLDNISNIDKPVIFAFNHIGPLDSLSFLKHLPNKLLLNTASAAQGNFWENKSKTFGFLFQQYREMGMYQYTSFQQYSYILIDRIDLFLFSTLDRYLLKNVDYHGIT